MMMGMEESALSQDSLVIYRSGEGDIKVDVYFLDETIDE